MNAREAADLRRADSVNPLDRPVLRLAGVHKSFGNVEALRGAGLELHRGSIHALMGSNGAGKSTLLNVLAGLVSIDRGTVEIEGEQVSIGHPRRALELGLSTVHQELSTIPDLTVLENLVVGRERQYGAGRLGWLDRRKAHRLLADLAAEFGLSRDDLNSEVSSFGALKKRAVEIVKALATEPKILILDEPTSGLEEHEKEVLFEHMRRLRSRGVSLVWVTHHLDEVFGLADMATVMRDGRTVATGPVAELTHETLSRHMFGQDAATLADQPTAADQASAPEPGQIRLRVAGLQRHGVFKNISFDVRSGEVLGFAGLAGAGRTEVARVLMGLDRADAGVVEVGGRVVRYRGVRSAHRVGLAMVPEDRKQLGILGELSIAENISVSRLGAVSRGGLIDRGKEAGLARHFVDELRIKTPGVTEKIRNLSGGNQQKVVIGRCLNTEPSVLIFDEPTQGIDVHAKTEVYRLIRSLAESGTAIIVISSEIPELIALSDRVVVMSRGELVGHVEDVSRRSAADYDMVKSQIVGLATRAA